MNFHFYRRKVAPKALDGNDVPSLARYIKSGKCQNVFLMLGAGKSLRRLTGSDWAQDWAGVSTSAGIPDFRSPETGLYANLARLELPYPEAVFQIDFFRKNPVPFYTLAKELYPGRYRPTITHSFIKVLDAHRLLHTCFTQNIDTLERRAGVPESKIVEAHGSFATQRCIECKRAYDEEKMKKAIMECAIPRCERCDGLVKPEIVFFGEALPQRFHASIRTLGKADLLMVVGTSLSVHPFASLVELVPADCPRVLINLDDVGDFKRRDDVVLIGRCDDVVRELCRELGWEEELERAWAATAGGVEDEDEDEVDLLARGMAEMLAVSEPVARCSDDRGERGPMA